MSAAGSRQMQTTKDAASVRRAFLRLPPTDGAPALARAEVADCCRRWQVEEVCDEAQIIVSELVTNVVTHAHTDAEVVLVLRDGLLHIQVRDGAFSPAPFPVRPLAALFSRRAAPTGGRGLLLVAALATAYGTTVGVDGKTVWATLRVPSSVVS